MAIKKFLLLCAGVLVILTSCVPIKAFVLNRPGAKDYKLFPAHELKKAVDPFCFHYSSKQLSFPDTLSTYDVKNLSTSEFLAETKTISFLVIRHDSILFQFNDQEFKDTTRVMSYSMAKSVTSMLIGCAIDDQLIHSVNDKVVDYLPELASVVGIEGLKIEHILNMRSGLDFNENPMNPYSDLVRLFYGTKFKPLLKNLQLREEPNTNFTYQNCDTELLGLILQRVLKGKSIAEYCNEKVWGPLGMENYATWSTFKNEDLEKAFCCVAATAIDFAKLGRLFLHKGNWNGTQLVSEQWVDASWQYKNIIRGVTAYNYQWWSINDHTFYADGLNGQYIYTDTEKDVIIVRLGHTNKNFKWVPFMSKIAESL